MNDIIWVTYRGRHIPIKKGMKAKFEKKEAYDKIRKQKIKEENIRKKYGDLSKRENYEKAQDDLVMNKNMSVEESEKILGDYKERYKNSPEGKEIKNKIDETQRKIDEIESNSSKNIRKGFRKVKVTGLEGEYNEEDQEKLKSLYEEKRGYEYQVDRVERVGDRATLSAYYKYFLSMGYSKETALEYAKEQVRNGGRKGTYTR